MQRTTRGLTLLLVVGSLVFSRSASAAEAVIAEGGRSLLPVVVAAEASDETKANAEKLAGFLGRMAGAKFEIQIGDGTLGIALGRAADFPALKTDLKLDPADPTLREDYVIHSHANGIWLVGASDLAVRHAMWDLLYRLGYRQFFPSQQWEIVPQQDRMAVEVDTFEHPSYYSRRIWYGYGAWDYSKEPYRSWSEKNRCVQGIELNTGHAYDGILARNKLKFAEHPEYLGLLDGERKSTKFCISNPGLRQLVVEDALAQFAEKPDRQSVSVDPSDGGGWCQCEDCARLGSVTDRAVTLANAVASGLAEKHPDKFVGMYAYSQHSPPPNIDVHPRVVISVATAFINGGFTIDQLLEGWAQRASILGIREYYSVNTWDRDLPGAARGSRPHYLAETIPRFYGKSARFLSAESSDNWGPNGLGYYIASRILWDVREADRVEELTADFLEKCFGTAQEPMAKFYLLLNGPQRQPLCDDLIGRMYRLLEEARAMTSDQAVQARLDDLTLYVRYVELWLDYSTTKSEARQAAFEKMIRHVYRMRETMLVHSLALYRDVRARDKSVAIPDEARFNVPEGKNPWKSSTPFSPGDLAAIRTEGILNRRLLDFTPVAFSDDLIPAAKPLKLSTSKLGSMGGYSRSPRTYFTWAENPPAKLTLEVTGGTVYTNRGATRIELYPVEEPEGKSVSQAEVPPTRVEQPVELQTTYPGLHRVEVIAGGGAKATWDEGLPMTIESSFENPGNFHTRWSLYFYVPRGTTTVGGFGEGLGVLRNAGGTALHTFDGKPGYFSVPVAEGEDGRLWKFEHCAGDKMLMTVPPYLARSAEELLLPREVVERDATMP